MIDAAGAIYVIGGYNVGTLTFYDDVWASTDGGARPDSVGGAGRRVHWVGTTGGNRVYYEGTKRDLSGTTAGTWGVLRGN